MCGGFIGHDFNKTLCIHVLDNIPVCNIKMVTLFYRCLKQSTGLGCFSLGHFASQKFFDPIQLQHP